MHVNDNEEDGIIKTFYEEELHNDTRSMMEVDYDHSFYKQVIYLLIKMVNIMFLVA